MLNELNSDIVEYIEKERKKAATRALDISLNELADMHDDGELVIRPEFQRFFRWSDFKQSQFIESLILEMPIPQIYVIEVKEGSWELIDGLQRISSYLHFRGQLDSPDSSPPVTRGQSLKLRPDYYRGT